VVQVYPLLDAARLLHDLRQVNEIAQSLSGRLNPTILAGQVTEALVQRFGCAFARIWLVEPDQTALRLVASAGLYTHINGSFARVPMGAYKVGKIAQNRVPFLSNQLAEETWVKDRQWALDNHIQGFAGYPLAVGERVLGVLASFSHAPLAPEFLEVLQVLCMTLTVALDAALQATPDRVPLAITGPSHQCLSDQMALVLGETQLTLMGTERRLSPSINHVFLQAAETLKPLNCSFCRLTYTPLAVMLEAIATVATGPEQVLGGAAATTGSPAIATCGRLSAVRSQFADLKYLVTCLGGNLDSQPVMQGQACQISLALPSHPEGIAIQVHCRQALLQQGFTQLARQAGLTVGEADAPAVALITDDPSRLGPIPTLWVCHGPAPIPEQATTGVNLSTTPEQLRQLIDQIMQGEGTIPRITASLLSGREQQVMGLLAEGMRDRDIAQSLYISESTVKFHINNSLTKLKAKNRYQGVYQAAIRGWI
jgi:DNA-binding CsgD family transcriptional regulator/GAF domain-containing protein